MSRPMGYTSPWLGESDCKRSPKRARLPKILRQCSRHRNAKRSLRGLLPIRTEAISSPVPAVYESGEFRSRGAASAAELGSLRSHLGEEFPVYAVFIYAKNERENLSAAQARTLNRLVIDIKAEARKRIKQ
jgi:hypothetical protein